MKIWSDHVLHKRSSLIANATFLHHKLNKLKHYLVDLNWYHLIVYLNLTADSYST